MREIKRYIYSTGYVAGYSRDIPEFIIWSNGPLKNSREYFLAFPDQKMDPSTLNTTLKSGQTASVLPMLNSHFSAVKASREEAFTLLCVDGTMSPSSFEKYVGVMDAHDGVHVIFSDKTSAKARERCLHLLESIKDILTKHDAAFIYDGTILFSATVRDNGRYYPNSRYLTIYSKIQNEHVALTDILHEFGHKFFYEDLDSEDRNAIKEDFDDLLSDHPPVNDAVLAGIKIGDVLTYSGRAKHLTQGNRRFIVTGFKGKDITYKPEDGPVTHNGKTYREFQANSEEMKNIEWQKDGKAIVGNVKADVWFPSIYATKNHEEWWAELFCHFMMDLLTGESKKFVKDVLKMGKVA